MKKIALVLIFILTLMACSVETFAYEFPHSFWAAKKNFDNAENSKNYSAMVEYGNQIVNIMQNAPEGKEKKANIVIHYNKIGVAYEKMGDYDNSMQTFKKLYDYASKYGDEFWDYVKTAQAKVNQYTSEISMYTDKGAYTYYGAKNEKNNGVLFGLCSDAVTRKKLSNESMILTYQELGQKLLAYNSGIVSKANSSGCAVEFALNCPNEGADIKNIERMNSYLEEISNLFKKYPNVPIYLRFGAEFDIWSVQAEPEEYKAAFRYVAEYFKSRNSNVAMVWSPNHTPNWYIDIDDYYPGDEWVDWVGVSLYAQRYFMGNKNSDPEDELLFNTGINSNPVVVIKNLVKKYGDRKPIMISECGAGHKMVKSGEDTSEFALRRLRELFAYLPMVYPQVKLIAYFDWYVEDNSEKSDFRLSTNTALQNEYLSLIKGPRFIQDEYTGSADLCYRKVTDNINVDSIFEVSCYAYRYGTNSQKVTYFIDDKYAGMSNEIPFTATVDATNYPGKHRLKAVVMFENGKTLTTESYININHASKDVTVEISGDRVDFDQEPIIYNSRTMVPMRKIFEELGANVSWDGNTNTATGKRGDRTVKITVGQKKMYVNSKEIALDTAPIIMGARTLVPVRAVAEGLGCTVNWDDKYYIVSITPKKFKWSDWEEDLPGFVDEDLYYVEEKTLYSFREKEYYQTDYEKGSSKYLVDVDMDYGNWSDWQNEYISSSDEREVQTRTQSTTKEYHYEHYCIGNIGVEEKNYRTWNYRKYDECTHHDLGWFTQPLEHSEDSDISYTYYVNGEKYRCSNTCFRWYLTGTTGGEYTQYRARDIYHTYTYWRWSDWTDFDDEDPYDYYDWDEIEVEEMIVYRYKEK